MRWREYEKQKKIKKIMTMMLRRCKLAKRDTLLITNFAIQYLFPRFTENQNEPLCERAKWQ